MTICLHRWPLCATSAFALANTDPLSSADIAPSGVEPDPLAYETSDLAPLSWALRSLHKQNQENRDCVQKSHFPLEAIQFLGKLSG